MSEHRGTAGAPPLETKWTHHPPVVQGSLQGIGVNGTPTLLLVNSAGVVTEAWSRKLPPAAEEAILARLRITN